MGDLWKLWTGGVYHKVLTNTEDVTNGRSIELESYSPRGGVDIGTRIEVDTVVKVVQAQRNHRHHLAQ